MDLPFSMVTRGFFAFLIVSAASSMFGSSSATAAAPDCLAAAAVAEREQRLPIGLLGAIGAVESHNRAFAVDIDGKEKSPDDITGAIEDIRSAAAQGARFIDVGCFQVDLRWHPDAFSDLAEAFDPLTNARVAARLLAELNRSSGSWSTAIARYHSSLAAEGLPYAARVLDRWRGLSTDKPASRPVLLYVAFGVRVFGPGEPATSRSGLPLVVTP